VHRLCNSLREQVKGAGQDPAQVEIEPWQLRDLRRTARTLMSRAGVSTDIAERCLGDVMTLVRGTYDRYDYLAEKRDALDKLAGWSSAWSFCLVTIIFVRRATHSFFDLT
jgi:hypothetical protein